VGSSLANSTVELYLSWRAVYGAPFCSNLRVTGAHCGNCSILSGPSMVVGNNLSFRVLCSGWSMPVDVLTGTCQ